MQSNMRIALKIMGMALFTSFLCLFVQISFHTLMKSFSTEVIAYDVYEVYDENTGEYGYVGQIEKDEKPANPEPNMKYVSVYSEMPQSAKIIETVLSSICSLGIFFCTTGTVFASVAAKDRNDCDFNGAEPDKLKGLKIGALAAIVPGVYYIAMLGLSFVSQNKVVNWFYWIYRFIIMGPVKPINDAVLSESYSNVSYDLSIVPTWSVAFHIVYILLFVAYGYAMYRICYNEESILAKLLYKSARKENNVRRLGGR